MKQYPSIAREINRNVPIYAFDKLDGSNIRAEWSKKHKAFTKFGSRTVLLGEDHPQLGSAIGMIKTKYEKDLSDIFIKERWEEVTCFFEFYGQSSIAGLHNATDPTLTATLFDINVYKQGQIYPNQFIKLFDQKVEIPALLYTGNITEAFEESVRSGQLEGMTFEGVVCKASIAVKRGYPPVMIKIKNRAWVEKIRQLCIEGGHSELMSELQENLQPGSIIV